MTSYKIFNDPVYGFIRIPRGILLKLIDHPYFQRLRRIKQLGLSDYVYPGALHSRFHHAIGALHLMTMALETLKSKGVVISDEETLGAQIAILLHDIGHGPFSHALEGKIIPFHHEDISVTIMEMLDKEYNGQLSVAIKIFKNEHPKKFLYQLVSGQLDMDRMDYLKRDSFFTGVAEGAIGHDRIIMMLDVIDGELVVEEKGIYSIEKFLIARRLMYWQVYLHKTVISAEQMMIAAWARIKLLSQDNDSIPETHLDFFLYDQHERNFNKKELIEAFLKIDDVDILYLIKSLRNHSDIEVAILSKGILDRELFKIILKNKPFNGDEIRLLRQRLSTNDTIPTTIVEKLIIEGSEENQVYSEADQEIKILTKSGEVKWLSKIIDVSLRTTTIRKHFLCYPELKT